MPQCPSDNAEAIDQSDFWDGHHLNWDAHRIGWAIAGGCTVLTIAISSVSIYQHCRHYTKPEQQRQILRILYMPPFFAIISFFSYRYFREYTYYALIQYVYEALALGAFLMLIIEYVTEGSNGHLERVLSTKGPQPFPLPFSFWKYNPSKEYFLYTIKWTVLQYVLIRLIASIAGIVCERFNVLCESEGFNPHFASVYIESTVFISISIALYGLLWFYGLMKMELSTRKLMAKFWCIKLIVMFTFYQEYLLKALQKHVLKATQFWTTTNIAEGLNALAICIEMVFFSAFMMYAYNASEYYQWTRKRGFWSSFLHSINFWDFVVETGLALGYYARYPKRRAEKSKSRSSTGTSDVEQKTTQFSAADDARLLRDRANKEFSGSLRPTSN